MITNEINEKIIGWYKIKTSGDFEISSLTHNIYVYFLFFKLVDG